MATRSAIDGPAGPVVAGDHLRRDSSTYFHLEPHHDCSTNKTIFSIQQIYATIHTTTQESNHTYSQPLQNNHKDTRARNDNTTARPNSK